MLPLDCGVVSYTLNLNDKTTGLNTYKTADTYLTIWQQFILSTPGFPLAYTITYITFMTHHFSHLFSITHWSMVKVQI